MQIQVNTDDNVEGRDRLAAHITSVITDGLGRFAGEVTRIEVHLSDENAGKAGTDDKRCMIEARPAGRSPVTVTHLAGSIEEAVRGATKKMRSRLETAFGRARVVKGGAKLRDGEPDPA